MATIFALVTAQHCFDLSLLCIDDQYLLLQHHAAILFQHLVGKMDQTGHLPPHIHTESHSSVNLCPVFYLKTCLSCPVPFREKLDGSHLISLFLGNNRHLPVCAKKSSSWIRKVLSMAMTHMYLGTLWGTAAEFLLQLDTVFFFQHIILIQNGTGNLCSMLSWALVRSQLVGKCHTQTYKMLWICWTIGLYLSAVQSK